MNPKGTERTKPDGRPFPEIDWRTEKSHAALCSLLNVSWEYRHQRDTFLKELMCAYEEAAKKSGNYYEKGGTLPVTLCFKHGVDHASGQ